MNVEESASTQAPDGRVLPDHVVPSVSSNSSEVVPRKTLSDIFPVFGTDIHGVSWHLGDMGIVKLQKKVLLTSI